MFDSAGRRFFATLVLVTVLLSLYSWINGRFDSQFDFAIGLDHAIPLLPWTLPVYSSLYVQVLLGAVLMDAARFVCSVRVLAIVSAVSFASFIALPSAYPRPDVTELDSIWQPALAWYYANDPPLNTFPSLHVAAAVVMAWMLRDVGRWQWWAAWSTLIAVSTLTTKQHFIADVVGGVVVAAAVIALVELRESRNATA